MSTYGRPDEKKFPKGLKFPISGHPNAKITFTKASIKFGLTVSHLETNVDVKS